MSSLIPTLAGRAILARPTDCDQGGDASAHCRKKHGRVRARNSAPRSIGTPAGGRRGAFWRLPWGFMGIRGRWRRKPAAWTGRRCATGRSQPKVPAGAASWNGWRRVFAPTPAVGRGSRTGPGLCAGRVEKCALIYDLVDSMAFASNHAKIT